MAEYIEREALRDELLNISIDISNLYNCGILEGLDRATKRLNEQPAADVTPVRHGRWEHNSDFPDRFICYGCRAMFDMWKHEQRLFNYCPNCGSKMDGGADNGC